MATGKRGHSGTLNPDMLSFCTKRRKWPTRCIVFPFYGPSFYAFPFCRSVDRYGCMICHGCHVHNDFQIKMSQFCSGTRYLFNSFGVAKRGYTHKMRLHHLILIHEYNYRGDSP